MDYGKFISFVCRWIFHGVGLGQKRGGEGQAGPGFKDGSLSGRVLGDNRFLHQFRGRDGGRVR